MVLTRAGTLVTAGSLVSLAAGRVLGIAELFVLGAAGALLVVVAVVLVLRGRSDLRIERTVRPARVHAGTPGRVELTITNDAPGTGVAPGTGQAGGRSPVVALHDPVTGTAGASLLVAPLAGGEQVVAAYRLPTDRRGIVRMGPLERSAGDPFGLARRRRLAGPATELTVLPRVDTVAPLPFTMGTDPLAGAEHPNALGRMGEDFYALRPYVVGDDMRRVHWPSTARAGDLLVRQDEQPWQGRVTVLLDVRRGAADPDTFEALVSAAASVVTACRRRGDLVRLVSTAGADTGFVSGHAQLDALMEHLAVVEASPAGTLARTLASLDAGGGTLVAMVGPVPAGDLDAVVATRTRFGGLTVVHFPGPTPPGTVSGAAVRHGHVRVVEVGLHERFDDAWNRVVPATRRRAW